MCHFLGKFVVRRLAGRGGWPRRGVNLERRKCVVPAGLVGIYRVDVPFGVAHPHGHDGGATPATQLGQRRGQGRHGSAAPRPGALELSFEIHVRADATLACLGPVLQRIGGALESGLDGPVLHVRGNVACVEGAVNKAGSKLDACRWVRVLGFVHQCASQRL